MGGYPRGFLSTLWWLLALILLSGLLLLPGALELRLEWDLRWQLPGGSRIAAAAVHALLAFMLSAAFGALGPLHMRSGWKRRQNRWTGIALICGFVLLTLSALGLYYVADETASRLLSLLHWILGLAATLPLAIHTIIGYGLRRQRLRHREAVRHRSID